MALLSKRLLYHLAGDKRKARVANHPGGIQGWEAKKFALASQARRRFRRKRHAWCIHSLAALCGSGSRGSNRLRLARRDRQVFTFADEGQAVLLLVPINANQVTEVNLLGRQQVRQRIDNVAFDGTFQVSCSIALVRSFLQQEVAAAVCHAKQELSLGGFQHTLLYLAQLDFENLLKLL